MEAIYHKQKELLKHPVYHQFKNLESLKHFMEWHVFAVWDFMSLLKSLQRQITCVSLPWRPSPYPSEMVRLINQIVLGEESDLDPQGNACSHFELYLKGMKEVGAKTDRIEEFLKTGDMKSLPEGVRLFIEHNLKVAQEGDVVEVAASFFFGREKLIPDMFQVIVDTLTHEKVEAPTFLYYLQRHIEVDSGEHGPLALRCLDYLIGGSEEKRLKAQQAGAKALEMRLYLWDQVDKNYVPKES